MYTSQGQVLEIMIVGLEIVPYFFFSIYCVLF